MARMACCPCAEHAGVELWHAWHAGAELWHAWHAAPVLCMQVLNYGTHGMQRDHEAAMHYLDSASKAGDAEAMGHLGHMHANGLVRLPAVRAHGKHVRVCRAGS